MAIGNVLRNLGSVLNPQVAQELGAEERQQQAIAQQIGMFQLQRQEAEKRALQEQGFRSSEAAANREAAERRAREAAIQRAEQFQQTHDLRVGQLDLQRDSLLQRAVSDEEKRRVDEWYKTQRLEADRQAKAMEERFKLLGLEVKAATGGGGGKAPSGYRFKADGQTLEPIPGGPATVLSPEQAAKTELLNNGIKDVGRYRDLVLKDGKIDRKIILGMATPGMAGIPGTDSRLAYSYIYNAIEAKLRAESGAAVPEAEVQRMAKRFVPSPLDNDETIKSKVSRLEEFLGGSLGRVKGQPGAGVPETKIADPLGIR